MNLSTKIKILLQKAGGFLLDILFPKICKICGGEKTFLCEKCKRLLPVFKYPLCPNQSCRKKLIVGRVCKNCREDTGLTRFFAALPYENEIVREMLWEYKYRFAKEISEPLTVILKNFLQENGFETELNKKSAVLAPVPLFRARKRSRGFNQSEEIAKVLSWRFRIPLMNELLIKIKESFPQAEIKGKDKEEIFRKREENVRGIFSCRNPGFAKGKIIILVDDVYTSGATMKECAKTLRQAGARQIWGIAVARG